MSMLSLIKACELIENNLDKGYVSGPKSEVLVAAAEKILKLSFPPTYRTFLKRYGCGGIAGMEIYGVTGENFENACVPNGVWMTLSARKFENLPSSSYYFPQHLIIIADGGLGDYYVLDTSKQNTNLENPVVIWEPGASTINTKLEKIADDFGDFLLQSLEAALKSEENT